jgi:hypothetical protein
MSDARFDDGRTPDAPLRLIALDAGDVPAISALVQDAVFMGADVTYVPKRRRFAVLLSRFRWEDQAEAEASKRPYERVRSLLVIDNISQMRSAGFDPKDHSSVQSLLAISFAPSDALGGAVTLVLAGGGAIEMVVETIDITLRDVTRPHRAVVQAVPHHGA